MNGLLLSCACLALMATQVSAFADAVSAPAQSSAYQAAREQLDTQREQLSGVASVAQDTTDANAFVDSAVDTSDAPVLVSQP
ncbi:hypothetical protein CCOS865_04042 [Pseudomonas reidholzensis]|uniref:Secreted protein n=1 Tax=Pseudomonas reidholzensis TaxID=1785162 RepID=A0A383RXJ8_9PSED|nr:hypothetical protein [Pseudomonas reidholzensis]SYX91762.1 hypothetical protein CCOS865_04042 [Pseudomonas reidholzensis]